MYRFELQYFEKFNSSLQQNAPELTRRLILHNENEEAVQNLKVQISLHAPLAEPRSLMLSQVEPKSSLEIGGLELELNTEKLAELTEPLLTKLQLDLLQEEEVLLTEEYPLELLPEDHWLGTALMPELLVSFVTPNAAEVAVILQGASKLLAEWTGNPSFDAYQSRNEDRVRKQMAAIFQAIAEQAIVYCEPPANFVGLGQRIRLVDRILGERLGTCLDMALLYASCLEAIGLHPLLFLMRGHAFAGAWLIDESLPDRMTDDASVARKRVAKGINEMAFVECVAMNVGSALPFDAATLRAEAHINEIEKFELLFDVTRCRLGGVRPLARFSAPAQLDPAFAAPVAVTPEKLAPKTEALSLDNQKLNRSYLWERKLLDLSLRNTLLNMRPTQSMLPLMAIKLNALEDALAGGKDFVLASRPQEVPAPESNHDVFFRSIDEANPLTPLLDSAFRQNHLLTYLSEKELQKSLTHLYRSARTAQEENGANTLFITLGLLRWYETESSERPRFAPILLMPIQIVRRRNDVSGYVIRSNEEDVIVNITLLEMLKKDYNINIQGLKDLPRDESGVDLTRILNSVREQLKSQKRWDVEEQAIIGTFSFSKFVMWNDIHNNADKLKRNPIVQSLMESQIKWEIPEEEELHLDTEVSPADLMLPMSADSCQMEAVYSAGKGESFVLHGPPGSGKSQTITNIIANALYQNKRVLFVAEKMAALSVVHRRLSQIGLGKFCLELHSNKATKNSVLKQLEEVTQYRATKTQADFQVESDKLFEMRHHLRQHVNALHHQYPLGYSLYDVLYLLEQAPAAPEGGGYRPAQGAALEITAQDWVKAKAQAEDLQRVAEIVGCPATHPLRDLKLNFYSMDDRERAAELLKELEPAVENLLKSQESVEKSFGIAESPRNYQNAQSMGAWVQVLLENLSKLKSTLLRYEDVQELQQNTQRMIRSGRDRDKLKEQLLKDYETSVLQLPAKELRDAWFAAGREWLLPRFFKQRNIRKSLQECSKGGKITGSQVVSSLDLLIAEAAEQRILDEYKDWALFHLGDDWQNWDAVQESVELLRTFLLAWERSFEDKEQMLLVKESLVQMLESGAEALLATHGKGLEGYGASLLCLQEKYAELEALLKLDKLAESQLSLPEQITWAQGIAANLDKLRDWCRWRVSAEKAQEEFLADYVDYLERCPLPPEQILAQFERGYYDDLLRGTLRNQPALSQFNGRIFEQELAAYRKLFKQHASLSQQELCAKLAAQIPNFTKEAAQSSEMGILQRSISSRGRGMTIRKLFDSLPNLMPRLKPCMLMSPISVAQYLDAGNEPFDLVIFDEASQMPTCDSVGALARGKSIIVVGDPKQMPPTSFFSSNTVDEENLDIEDLESILEDCLAISMPSKHLLWHYRSQHESLIAFSNAQYYENKLFTFPSPDDIRSKVNFVHVEGFYDRGKTRCNKAEAEAIVEEILRRLKDVELCKQSIGVVTFSLVQQMLIEDMLMQAFTKPENAVLESLAMDVEEPIFIKNIENVQGDERDVILFSIGYGADSTGKVSYNFGPLNREGGWRRLNVAVSRARVEMKIFSSLFAEQIDLSRTSSLGVLGLRSFLEFAQKGKAALVQKIGDAHQMKKSLVDVIANELRERGYKVHTHVGSSGYRVDLAVVHPEEPEQYLAALVCDGESYQKAQTLRDREVTRIGVLQSLAWPILRIWILDWLHERDRLMEQLEQQLQEILETSRAEKNETPLQEVVLEVAPQETLPYASAEDKSENQPESLPQVQESMSAELPYTHAEVQAVSYTEESPLIYKYMDCMKGQIEQIIEYEAPIHREQLTRKLMELWQLNTLGKLTQAFFDELFISMGLHRTEQGGSFYFWRSAEQEQNYQNYRMPGSRKAEWILPQELAIAAREVMDNQIAMPRLDLQGQLIELFELGRKTQRLRDIVDQGITFALQTGTLLESGEQIKLP